MLFETNTSTNIHITYKQQNIEQVKEFKYLGIIVDSKLNWKEQVKYTKAKSAAMAGVFKRIAPNIPTALKKSIYYSLFHARLTYGIISWISSYRTTIQPLQVLQNKAIKHLFQHNQLESTKLIHNKENILTLVNYANMIMAIHIHNILKNQIRTNTTIYRNCSIHSHNTRNAVQLNTGPTNTTRYQQSTLQKSIQIYNYLPDELKTYNKNRFKTEVKQFFLTQQQ